MKKLLALFLLIAAPLGAQTYSADRFRLNPGPCILSSGSGSPESVVTGNVCDTYYQTNSPYDIWRKTSGTGNTGWVKDTGGLLGSGNYALLNAANIFTAGYQTFVADSGSYATRVRGRASDNIGTMAFYDNAGSTRYGYVQATSTSLILQSDAGTASAITLSTGAATVQGGLAVTGLANVGTTFGSTTTYGGGSAIAATEFRGFANSTYGAAIAGFGTTYDFAVFNKNFGDAILVPTGTRNVTIGQNLLVNNLLNVTGVGTFSANVMPAAAYFSNLGSLQFKWLTLHAAELWVETLVAQNTIATVGGRVLVAPTNILVTDISTSVTTINVKYNNFAVGDRVYMEAAGKVEHMAVTASGGSCGTDCNIYTVTRDLDGSGGNLWYAGDAILDTGTTGNGFIDIYSVRGVKAGTEVGPTIVGNVRNSATYNDWSPRWAIGNLDGLYSYSGSAYGVAMGNPAATNITIDATNGFRIRSGTTNKLVADTSGNLSLVGDLSIGTAGVFRSGATAFGTGTGYWLDYNAGTPRFRVGTTAGNRINWDGTDLTLISANLTIDAGGPRLPVSSLGTGTHGLTWTVMNGWLGIWGTQDSSSRQVQLSANYNGASPGAGSFFYAGATLSSTFTGAPSSSIVVRSGENNLVADSTISVSANEVNVVGGSSTGDAAVVITGTITASVNLLSGAYTPTLTDIANTDARTASACTYFRVVNTVTVTCYLEVDPTTTATRTRIGISLPIASNFTTTLQGAGVGGSIGTVAAQGGSLYTDVANDRMTYDYFASSAANQGHTITFTYQVL